MSFTFLRKLAVAPIRFYQYCISPLFPARCRFYPTCSAYAKEAVLRHGVLRGFVLAAYRILRCNPWSPGGYDPVPPPKDSPYQRKC
ncbi:membrane protein insertion efficiency factor YidD [Desulfovibrio sp. OttesenSCG-928-A18]|nr:membrane protein insertion efficiency factor YidD [Desulfovibrio sp. OttesenSCG-928-A18]